MKEFPLNAFLTSLESDGIVMSVRDYRRLGLSFQAGGEWSIARLRNVLISILALNEEQRDVILRRFNRFFGHVLDGDAEKDLPEFDIRRVLDDLRGMVEGRGKVKAKPKMVWERIRPTDNEESVKPVRKSLRISDLRRWVLLSLNNRQRVWLTLMMWLVVFGVGFYALKLENKLIDILQNFIQYLEVLKGELFMPHIIWKFFLVFVSFSCLFFLGYELYLWRLKRGPKKDESLQWNKNKNSPSRFNPGVIGGSPASRLDNDTLAWLADSMGYFKSDLSGNVLDVRASLKKTIKQGGLPQCVFHARTRVRTLLILEDSDAEALSWNPISQELAAGMIRFGVPVIYGRFRGTPEKFKAEDGTVYNLDDLEDHRKGILLLIFTDGKTFQRWKKAFIMESLAKWSMIAWMELRDKRFWDESTELALRRNIPVYPANKTGLVQAMRRYMTERGAAGEGQKLSENEPLYLPELSAGTEYACIERFLGDALFWAQDCSMIQPVSLGLADLIRRERHPNLPPERIELLYKLPNTTRTNAGLRFFDDVLKVLREGFWGRRSEKEQDDVIDFIIGQVDLVKPDVSENSLAYLSWKALNERVRMEKGGDNKLERLKEFMASPLKKFVEESTENFAFAGDNNTSDKIPTREVINKKGLHRLARISEGRITNSIGMEFVLIKAGSFMMGSPENEPKQNRDETRHRVTLTDDFYMQTTTVTQGQWKAIMGNNPSRFKDCSDDCPVETVSWDDTREFIEKLNTKEKTDGYSLPTEAQWEYAARAGTETAFAFGNCLSTDQANYDGNYPLAGCKKGECRGKTIPVGSLAQNRWGLYDMHGNVWEWCQDWHGEYPEGSVTNPTGPSTGSVRVLRGGSWGSIARFCRSAFRDWGGPGNRYLGSGFRLVLLPGQKQAG